MDAEDTHRLSTPDQILRAAMAREVAAFRFYSDLLKANRPELVRDLLLQLKDEEEKHIHLVERRMRELNLGHDPLVR